MSDRDMAGAGVNWMVVRWRDNPGAALNMGFLGSEVIPFTDEGVARLFHEQAQTQWSECYLVRVVKVGAQPDREAWQPIATAPKNRAVLVWASGWYRPSVGTQTDRGTWMNDSGGLLIEDGDGQPFAWMELPGRPAAA